MVAGVRRMAACLIIKQVEALGLCSNFQMDDEVKPIVRQVTKVLIQFLNDQGKHLDNKVEFRERHQDMLA